MTLEATMLVLDNSDWMRNGDYTPSREDAQADAVNLLFQAKQQSHPENTVGVMTMAGKVPEVLATLTSDLGKILNALHKVSIGGTANLSAGIQVAQLALKHRRNRNQRQRVIAFVGSPVEEDEASLVRLAKKLKKNNVAVDIISFGEDSENREKLESFVNNVNSGDNSRLVSIPPGPHLLSDALLSSALIAGDRDVAGAMSGGGGRDESFEFGIDPSMDPELAMALRISLEEEQARQAAAAAASSSAQEATGDASADGASDSTAAVPADVVMGELTEEEQIARAIEMSLQGEAPSAEFASSMLAGLSGVDVNDPRVQEAMGASTMDVEEESTTDKKEEGGEKQSDGNDAA